MSLRWALMERFEVPSLDKPGELHFVRWRVIQTPWFSLYIHRFDNPDSRQLHDHPWPFVSFILRGGYEETRAYDRAPVTVRRANVRRSTDLHYISRLLRTPTWTVLLVGPRIRTWGFVDPDGVWTRHDQHPAFEEALARRTAEVGR